MSLHLERTGLRHEYATAEDSGLLGMAFCYLDLLDKLPPRRTERTCDNEVANARRGNLWISVHSRSIDGERNAAMSLIKLRRALMSCTNQKETFSRC